MKVNYDHNYTNRTNVLTEDTQFSLDENALAHLMMVMSDLYSDTELAVIREYACNALDSHIAAGVKRPIEVTLPSDFKPEYVVKDYGTGMSPDDLRNVYTKYGYSTKRETDAEVGMLGLGCKAALAYTESFTVEAVKAGIKTLAVVSHDDEGVGVLRILDTSATDAPNGVTIKVPVKPASVMKFARKADDHFRFWGEGTILVDGVEPARPDGIWLDDQTVICKGVPDHIVMGHIGYPVRYNELSHDLGYGWNVVHYAEMGAVGFAPSREALNYTPKTEAYIDDLSESIVERVKAKALGELAVADTASEALAVASKYRGIIRLGLNDLTWKGKRIPNYFKSPDGYEFQPARHRYKVQSDLSVHIDYVSDYLWITGFDLASVSPRHRAKIEKYCEDNDLDYSKFAIVKTMPEPDWTAGLEQVAWDDISAVKLPTKRGNGSGGLGGDYRVFIKDGYKWETWSGDDLADYDKGDVLYYSNAEFTEAEKRINGYINLSELLPYIGDNDIVIEMGKNRWDKFERDVRDDIVHLFDKADKNLVAKIKAWQKRHGLAVEVDSLHYDSRYLLDLDVTNVEDSTVVDFVEKWKDVKPVEWQHRQTYNNYTQLRRALGKYGDVEAEGMESARDEFAKVLDLYPFLRYTGNVSDSHIITYINAVYSARKEAE